MESLTFGHPDYMPLTPGDPRESTFAAWHTQGLLEGTDYRDALPETLDLPRDAFDSVEYVSSRTDMIPKFEEKVLEQGNTLVMPPGQRHSFTGIGPALLLEVSMPSLWGDNFFDDRAIGADGMI